MPTDPGAGLRKHKRRLAFRFRMDQDQWGYLKAMQKRAPRQERLKEILLESNI